METNKELKTEKELTPDTLINGDYNQKRKYIYSVMNNMGIAKDLSKEETIQFIDICCMYALNPLKKEIYVSSYNNKNGSRTFSIMIAYQVYLQKANQTNLIEIAPTTKIINEFMTDKDGKFILGQDGLPKKTPLANIICEFRCKRKDQTETFTKYFRMGEYNKGQSIWLQMPYFMLEKCAIAGGLRQLFPLELGTLPYIAEEQWAQNLKQAEPIIQENISTEKLVENKNE